MAPFLLAILFTRPSFSKEWLTIRRRHKTTSQSDAPCGQLQPLHQHFAQQDLRCTFGEESLRVGEVEKGAWPRGALENKALKIHYWCGWCVGLYLRRQLRCSTGEDGGWVVCRAVFEKAVKMQYW